MSGFFSKWCHQEMLCWGGAGLRAEQLLVRLRVQGPTVAVTCPAPCKEDSGDPAIRPVLIQSSQSPRDRPP